MDGKFLLTGNSVVASAAHSHLVDWPGSGSVVWVENPHGASPWQSLASATTTRAPVVPATPEQISALAAAIMDRAERDGKGFHKSSIEDEIAKAFREWLSQGGFQRAG